MSGLASRQPVLFKERRGGRPSNPGFTLLELLVVIAIMAILMALSIPAIKSSMGGNRITIGEQMIVSQLGLARQIALSEGTPVQVRFFSYAGELGDPAAFRAMQVLKLQSDGTYKAATPVQRFPQAIVALNSFGAGAAATDPSSLLLNSRASSTATGDGDLPGNKVGTYNVASFDFRPDGSTTLDSTNSWHITIGSSPLPATGLPKNFATVQVDPLNGTTRTYRP